MLLDKDKSCLLLIDIQEKLTPKVKNYQELILQCEWLLRLASEMDVPVLVCEQYPKGLGHTIEPLLAQIPVHALIEKVSFSAYRDPNFQQQLQSIHRKQIILTGIETHVCVMQTALDLIQANYDVYVVSNAISARYDHDHQVALDRMRQAGVQIVTSEMIFFEWTRQAGTPVFKALTQSFMK